jgi:NAD-dependent dihydropyrimidine dehydrogenase PreA subunit
MVLKNEAADRPQKTMARPARLELDGEECKGCGLCVEACPPRVLWLSERLNRCGYHPVTYRGSGCTGCGICYLVCPEPSAIAVLCAT